MRLFRHLMRSSPRVFLAALVAGLVSGAAGAAFIVMVNLALVRGADPAVVWGFTVLCAVTVLARFAAQSMLFRLSQDVIYRMRRALVDGVLGAPLRQTEQLGPARLYSALSDDVIVIADVMPGLPAVCSGAAFVVVSLIYLVVVSPVVAGAALLATVVGAAVYRLFSIGGMRRLNAAREYQDQLFEHFRAVTEGTKELKLDRARRAALAGVELDRTALAYRDHGIRGLTVFEGAAGSGQALFFALIGVLLFLFPLHFAVPRQTLADAVMVLLFLVASLQGVLIWVPQLGRASAALGKVEELLDALPATPTSPAEPAEPPVPGSWRRVELRGVRHVYPGPRGESFTLGPVDLVVRRGEVLFVVGGNGSGKTTLAKLITGLYEPEEGLVLVDGVPVAPTERDDYRQSFAAVFTDFFLFDSLLGLPAADRESKAHEYLRRLQLDHKVRIEGDRFSTTALSQGQRKRLALLTAYLSDRPCYVFDEWAADQDPVFKDVFYRELLPELRARDKAVVVISHDDRYFGLADRLVRLENGLVLPEEVPGGLDAADRTRA
ncbi:MAG: cyclic peptide export ABC transporter [Saccharothrix sp.]|nr:cyclic peptide export ABC transporter [Saccharothrix sp.]